MQTITWTPKLNYAIRALKKMDTNKIASVSNKKNFLQSFGLTQEEQHAVSSITTQKSENAGTLGLWN
jgi:hypothetical protein